MTRKIPGYTKLPIFEQINLRALYSPLYFYIAANCHDWKTSYPCMLLRTKQAEQCGIDVRRETKKFMIDSLNTDITPAELIKLQQELKVNTFIARDSFRDPDATTKLIIEYLTCLLREEIFPERIMLIIQGDSVKDYITHFDTLLVLANNSAECINCNHAGTCKILFRQNLTSSNISYHERHHCARGEKEKRKWTFTFGIGGLIRRAINMQERIIKAVIQHGIEMNNSIQNDVLPKRTRDIMTNTRDGTIKRFDYPPIQFHVLGVGASKKIFPLVMQNQPYIESFDSSVPSLIATVPKFFDKKLAQFPTKKEQLRAMPYETLTFREEDDVGNVAALNALRAYYNTAMILYAMESNLKMVRANETINMLKRFIPRPPKSSSIDASILEFISPVMTRKEKILLGSGYEKKKNVGMADEKIIGDALKRWTASYRKTGRMNISLALLRALVILQEINTVQVLALIPSIKSPSAAMNVITDGYEICEYPICEDARSYGEWKKNRSGKRVLKTIRIKERWLRLVLKHVLADASKVDEYMKYLKQKRKEKIKLGMLFVKCEIHGTD